MNEDDKHWHLDKRVPIALIITLFVQAAAAVWWAAQMSARVETLENWVSNSNEVINTVVRLEERIEGQGAQLNRIEGYIRQR